MQGAQVSFNDDGTFHSLTDAVTHGMVSDVRLGQAVCAACRYQRFPNIEVTGMSEERSHKFGRKARWMDHAYRPVKHGSGRDPRMVRHRAAAGTSRNRSRHRTVGTICSHTRSPEVAGSARRRRTNSLVRRRRVHVENTQASYDAALAAGAESVRPPTKVMAGVCVALSSSTRRSADRVLRSHRLTRAGQPAVEDTDGTRSRLGLYGHGSLAADVVHADTARP